MRSHGPAPPNRRWASPRLVGRIAAVFYVGGGVFTFPTLLLSPPKDMNRAVISLVAVTGICIGIFAWFAPWDRVPAWASLVLVPVALGLISLSNAVSGYQPYAYGIYYVVLFVWVGVAYPPWTSLWVSPLAILSYVLPLTVLPGDFGAAAGSAAIVVPTCVMVGEVLSRGHRRLRRTDEALRESQERARGLADAAFEAIVLHEGDRILEANLAFGRLFGYTPQEFEGLTMSRLRMSETDPDAGGNGDLQAHQTTLRRGDGTTFAAEVAGGPLPYQGRSIRVTVVRDITAYQEALEKEHAASQRLRTLDEMKNTFLNAVSHELRTPLAAVLGTALTLERLGVDLDSLEQRDLLHAVSENARKLERMLADLLDLDRLTRGVLELRRQTVDLLELIRQVVDGTPMRRHHVEVRGTPLPFPVDGPKVERIVENLLANAVKYVPEECPIWIRVEATPAGALIVVEDAGPGVPADTRCAIFEPFRQGANARGDSPGVGIGLSLVSRFAELHGGKAWVEERDGGGASFHVLLRDGSAPAETPPGARIEGLALQH